ncbi:MAG: endonuclease domain-containing protein [Clostridia bacterium]|nr:endonuclease domain-containing protein [Clostridia bacterium]
MAKFPYDKDMTGVAQTLRKRCTPEENKLWYQFLKSYPIQFRRQKPFGRYVLDFYCAKAKLGIELDGAQHFHEDGLVYDENRTQYLNSLGIQVIRFTNHEINTDFTAVCSMIDSIVRHRLND